MRHFSIVSLMACLAVANGCNYCCCGKFYSEKHCPTDVRKSHFWCFGEDALFDWPCGPNKEFYGHKPTCWREWPAPGAAWRDLHCAAPVESAMPVEEELYQPPMHVEPPATTVPDAGNPFGNDTPATQPPNEPATQTPKEPQSLPLLEGSGNMPQLPPSGIERADWQQPSAPMKPYVPNANATMEEETSAALRHYMSIERLPATDQ